MSHLTQQEAVQKVAENMPLIMDKTQETLDSMDKAGLSKVMLFKDAISPAMASAITEVLGIPDAVVRCLGENGEMLALDIRFPRLPDENRT